MSKEAKGKKNKNWKEGCTVVRNSRTRETAQWQGNYLASTRERERKDVRDLRGNNKRSILCIIGILKGNKEEGLKSTQRKNGWKFPKFDKRYNPTGASLVAQLVKNLPTMQKTPVQFLVWKTPWRRDRLPTPVSLNFPCGSDGKGSTCNVEDLSSIPGLEKSPGGGHGNPPQYSCLENPCGQRSLVG